jgi:hypothetical protein
MKFIMTPSHLIMTSSIKKFAFFLLVFSSIYSAKANVDIFAKVNNTSACKIDTIKPEIKSKSNYSIIKSKGDQTIELTMEDDQVTSLKIDGKLIDQDDYVKYQDIIDDAKPSKLGYHRSGGEDDMEIFFNGERFDMSKMAEKMKEFSIDNFGEKGEKIKIFSGDDDLFTIFDNMRKRMGKMDTTFQSRLGELGNRLNMMEFKFDGLDSLMKGSFKNLENLGGVFQIDDFENNIKGELEPLFTPKKKGVQATLAEQLSVDGYKVKDKSFDIEITDKYLKIDGTKQSDPMHNKYKKLIEIETGMDIEDGTKLNFKVTGKEKRKIIKG